jgi:hypothetical protein
LSVLRWEQHPAYNIFNTSVSNLLAAVYKNKNMKKAKEQKTDRYEKMPVVK